MKLQTWKKIGNIMLVKHWVLIIDNEDDVHQSTIDYELMSEKYRKKMVSKI